MLPQRQSISHALEAALLKQISAGTLKEGDRLPPEQELALSYGISRASVREALKRLQRVGVIRTVQGSGGGSFVQRLDLSIVTDALTLLLQLNGITLDTLMEARRALAPSVAALAAERATDADVDELEALCNQAAAGLAEDRFEAEAFVAFHIKLASMTRNSYLEAVATPLAEVTGVIFRRLWRFDLSRRLPALLEAHRTLLAPLRTHDSDLARARMQSLMATVDAGVGAKKLKA